MTTDLQQKITSSDYWQQLNPELSMTNFPFKQSAPIKIQDSTIDKTLSNLLKEGYFQTSVILPADQTTLLAKAIENVVAAGFPAVFAFVYDDFWGLVRNLKRVLDPVLGENHLLSPGDMWIWCVDEHGHTSSWGPHRDMHDPNVLHSDGRLKLLTAWIPLTDVSPLNGCMYLVPKHLDPNIPDNLPERTLAVETMQHIRALPAAAGSVLGWSPLLLHWGGSHSRHAIGPRISIAFYLNDGSNEYKGGIPAVPDTFVPFWYRLGVIGAMISLFDGSPLANDLKFSPSIRSILQPYLNKVLSGN